MKYIRPISDIFIKYLFGMEEDSFLPRDFINATQKNCGLPLITDLEVKNIASLPPSLETTCYANFLFWGNSLRFRFL